MNFSILLWFRLMFGNHTNLFCHAVVVDNYKVKKWRDSQQVPILHAISREHYTTYATQLFIDRSGVPHAHVECAPRMGHIHQKSTLFKLSAIFF